jgi:hypothetical protein
VSARLIKIYEKHYEVSNPLNYQERVNEHYETFEEYLSHLLSDKSKHPYPSLPRRCEILSSNIDENSIMLEFVNPVNKVKYIHSALVIK